jgi:hexosaminidase
MKNHNLLTYDDLVVYHMARARYLLTNMNKTKRALYWSNPETFYQEYRDDDVLVYWGESKNITDLPTIYPKQKYVMAPGDYYYMDCGFGNKYGENAWCDPFKTFLTIYSFEPTDYINGTSVLGAEIATWSELNGDQNLHAKTWPRGAAMADKIWSQKPSSIDLVGVSQRQTVFANYLNARGIPTSSVNG